MAANTGFPRAQIEYWTAFKNYEELLAVYLEEAERGVVPAMVQAAESYRTGRGLPDKKPEPLKAVEMFEMAKEKGSLQALYALSRIYETGMPGVPKDPQKAAEYKKTLALRAILFPGPGSVPADYYKAYFENVLANLASLPDEEAADLLTVLRTAVRNVDACYYLARFYQTGTASIDPDPQLHLLFLHLAANGTYRDAALKEITQIFKDSAKTNRADSEFAERYQRIQNWR